MLHKEAESTNRGKVLCLVTIISRVCVLMALALLVRLALNRISVDLHRKDATPAGFGNSLAPFSFGKGHPNLFVAQHGRQLQAWLHCWSERLWGRFLQFPFWRLRRIWRWAEAHSAA
jgi:hypothetical protein